MVEGIRYAQSRGREVLLAINTYAQAGRIDEWRRAVDAAVGLGVDALILADVGCSTTRARCTPKRVCICRCRGPRRATRRSTSLTRCSGIRRAVLPRVLTLAQVEQVIENTPVEIEVFGSAACA